MTIPARLIHSCATLKDVSTPRSNSASDAAKRTSVRQWDRSATVTTTPCARASSPRSSASCSTGRVSPIGSRPNSPSSTSSRASHASAPLRDRLYGSAYVRTKEWRSRMTPRVASAPDDVKLRCAQLLRFAPALRVTSSSAAARCIYAESGAFGASVATRIIKPASARFSPTPNHQPVHGTGASSNCVRTFSTVSTVSQSTQCTPPTGARERSSSLAQPLCSCRATIL
jgi:hypothetical protein